MVAPSTFSIVARDAATGDFGIAVASKFLAAGAVVPWAKAGVGAVATQAYANTAYGPNGLHLLERGATAHAALIRLTEADAARATRQVGIVDAQGRAAAHTGADCPAWAGHVSGDGFTCQGNILAGPSVVAAMAAAFPTATGTFAQRLLAAMDAGEAAGGDRRGKQSAALLVVRERGGYGGGNDRFIDLRVDDHPNPLSELRRLLGIHGILFGSTPARLVPVTPEIVAALVAGLRGAGFYAGDDTTTLTPPLRVALERFAGNENLEERLRDDDRIDAVIMDAVRRHRVDKIE